MFSKNNFFQRKSLGDLRSGKKFCSVLGLSLLLLGPLRALAQSQEEQPSAEAPTQAIEVEFHPLASVLTAMNIPARAALCGLNSWMASIVMVFSAGMRYADAGKMMEEGCSGPWIITPEMLEENREKEKDGTSSGPRGGEKPLQQDGESRPTSPLN